VVFVVAFVRLSHGFTLLGVVLLAPLFL
jgi:hypothetical protein